MLARSRACSCARDEKAYLPRIPDEIRPRLGGRFLEQTEVWVAEENGRVIAFAGVDEGELTHLYTAPEAQGRGVGSARLEYAKALRPDGLDPWVFQKNAGARRFYERNGFRLVRLTDGEENMEREPDTRYSWRPASSSERSEAQS